jgi:hypothetical protein
MESCAGPTSSSTKKIILFSGPGTRRWPRFSVSEVPWIKNVSIGSGARTNVVNVSRGGTLLQTRRRIARGTGVDLHLNTAEGTVQLTGLVLRSSISSLKGIPQYHAAVAFDRPLNIFDEPPGPIAEDSRTPAFISSPSCPFPPDRRDTSDWPIQDGRSAMIEAFCANSFYGAPDVSLDELPDLNDW